MTTATSPTGSTGSRRSWRPPFPLDVAGVLAPLRRGRGDPAWRPDQAGVIWLAGNTPAGAGTLAISSRGDEIRASAWGPGAAWLLDGLPTLLGADDDDQGFVAHHPLIARLRRRLPGLRLGATGRVWDVLLAAVLEQKVTSFDAHRLWRELTHRFGTPAPGPVPAGLAVPPTRVSTPGAPCADPWCTVCRPLVHRVGALA